VDQSIAEYAVPYGGDTLSGNWIAGDDKRFSGPRNRHTFEVIGAPWLDGQKLAKYLNERNIPGVRFVPIRFKPNASVFKDENLGGVNLVVTDRKVFKPVRTGIEIATALRKLYPTEWQVERYGRLLVNEGILDEVKRGATPDEIEKLVRPKNDEFLRRRAPFLLYK
jgi:uncharacterized protein YbbC (DUF1343 family)